MRRLIPLLAISLGVLSHTAAAEDGKASQRVPSSRAVRPPRKVVVGTVVFPNDGKYPGLAKRLEVLGSLVDEIAQQASVKYPNRGLDLAVLPETTVTSPSGPASERAIPLEGSVRDTFGALARKHKTYIVVPLDLAEIGTKGTRYSNAAVLFDRRGDVAGIYRKAHPVALVGSDDLEGGITPGEAFPVFDCDFGKLGIQICWDVQFDDGWAALARKGAEIVAWPTASPATAQPASRAAQERYYVVSSTPREDATIFEPTGMVAAQIEAPRKILIHELDLSFAVLGWSAPLRNGLALSEKYGDRAGYHYSAREDLGLFWSNDPKTTIGEMLKSIGLEELDAQVERNRRLHDSAGKR
jgi:predicted amidohydrolase